jgi:excisionase family DNA binding protein
VAGYEWIGGVVSDSLLSELMTTAQVAELLQMKRTTVEDYARRGLLPSLKLGRHRRFVRSDVEAALVALRDQEPRDSTG